VQKLHKPAAPEGKFFFCIRFFVLLSIALHFEIFTSFFAAFSL